MGNLFYNAITDLYVIYGSEIFVKPLFFIGCTILLTVFIAYCIFDGNNK